MDQQAFNTIIAIGLFLAGVAYAFGQFTNARKKAQADAFEVALKEIEVLRIKSDRQGAEIESLKSELVAVRAAADVLRDALASGVPLSDTIRHVIAEEIAHGVDAVVTALRVVGHGE